MNDFVGLVVQSVNGNLDRELAHLAWSAAATLFSCFTALCGGLVLFLVKRAIRQHDEWKAGIESEIAGIKSAMGLTGVTKNRPADGDGRAVL